jgi:hypothetical protein
LRKAYFQIFIHPHPPFGLFELLHLPLGLMNAGSSFQHMVDTMLAGISFVFVYLDDIIVASKSMKQHQKDVEEVFHHFQSAWLVTYIISLPGDKKE